MKKFRLGSTRLNIVVNDDFGKHLIQEFLQSYLVLDGSGLTASQLKAYADGRVWVILKLESADVLAYIKALDHAGDTPYNVLWSGQSSPGSSASLEDLRNDVSGTITQLNQLVSEIAAINSDIEEVVKFTQATNTTVTAWSETINALSNSFTTLETAVNKNKSASDTNANAIAVIEATIAGFANYSADITNLETLYATLLSAQLVHGEKIAVLEAQSTDFESRITILESAPGGGGSSYGMSFDMDTNGSVPLGSALVLNGNEAVPMSNDFINDSSFDYEGDEANSIRNSMRLYTDRASQYSVGIYQWNDGVDVYTKLLIIRPNGDADMSDDVLEYQLNSYSWNAGATDSEGSTPYCHLDETGENLVIIAAAFYNSSGRVKLYHVVVNVSAPTMGPLTVVDSSTVSGGMPGLKSVRVYKSNKSTNNVPMFTVLAESISSFVAVYTYTYTNLNSYVSNGYYDDIDDGIFLDSDFNSTYLAIGQTDTSSNVARLTFASLYDLTHDSYVNLPSKSALTVLCFDKDITFVANVLANGDLQYSVFRAIEDTAGSSMSVVKIHEDSISFASPIISNQTDRDVLHSAWDPLRRAILISVKSVDNSRSWRMFYLREDYSFDVFPINYTTPLASSTFGDICYGGGNSWLMGINGIDGGVNYHQIHRKSDALPGSGTFIGIATTATVGAGTVTVALPGSVISGVLAGLTAGKEVYVAFDGTLTQSPSAGIRKIGSALKTDALLLTTDSSNGGAYK